MQNEITSFYADDHNQLDGYLKKFRELKRTNYSEAKENFKRFKFGLQRHIVWEESILFPIFEDKTSLRDIGPTVLMRQEHRQIEQALEALHKKVQRQDPESESEEQLLMGLLEEHNTKEENILYPVIDELTTQPERKKIFKEMQDLPEEKYKTCCHIKLS